MAATRAASAPWSRSAATAAAASGSKRAASVAASASSSFASTLAWRSVRTSATPMPNADSTPASGWMMTRRMPSISATCAACCPPAPPKQHSAKRVTSWPRCTEICLIAFAMRSTAIRKNPAASCSSRGVSPVAAATVARQLRECVPRCVRVERLVGIGAEHARKELGLNAAEQQVRVGHRRRPAVPVTRGPRVGARGLRADLEPALAERQDRAAAGSDGLNPQHRRADANLRDHGVRRALELAGVERDVRRRAAHVEADDLAATDGARRAHHADDAAGRSRQQAVLAAKVLAPP